MGTKDTKFTIVIENTGTILPTLAEIIGKHNSGKQKTDLIEIDMFLFRIRTEMPGTVITTKKKEWDGGFFNLDVYENGVLVAVIEADEVWALVDRNAVNDIPEELRQYPLGTKEMIPLRPIAN